MGSCGLAGSPTPSCTPSARVHATAPPDRDSSRQTKPCLVDITVWEDSPWEMHARQGANSISEDAALWSPRVLSAPPPCRGKRLGPVGPNERTPFLTLHLPGSFSRGPSWEAPGTPAAGRSEITQACCQCLHPFMEKGETQGLSICSGIEALQVKEKHILGTT